MSRLLSKVKASCEKNKVSKAKSSGYEQAYDRAKAYVKVKMASKQQTESPVAKVSKPPVKVAEIVKKYDSLMVKSERLYKEFDNFDAKGVLLRVDFMEQMYKRISV
mmetsp:Transcript_1721/g.2157  ORF Transcript_1721/g.2157 Transcript_1721/m.2157 type:complete len:106 (+) Transcript_1721:617-934(+)